MMKKNRSKEMTGEEVNTRNKSEAKKLRCVRECVMPNVGHFKHGEFVDRKDLIARIADNPNFEIVTEEASQ